MMRLALMAAWLASGVVSPAMAEPDFFAAALCQPPYSIEAATRLYDAAEKLGKADMSMMGAAVYRLPTPVERDGFTAGAVVFAGSAVGVLLDGQVAQKLALRYGLAPEKSRLLGASTQGFARTLPEADQAMKELGLISIIAREGPAMGGKTLLACEFVSAEDRKALEAYEAAR